MRDHNEELFSELGILPYPKIVLQAKLLFMHSFHFKLPLPLSIIPGFLMLDIIRGWSLETVRITTSLALILPSSPDSLSIPSPQPGMMQALPNITTIPFSFKISLKRNSLVTKKSSKLNTHFPNPPLKQPFITTPG
jgi:hypothetical protein